MAAAAARSLRLPTRSWMAWCPTSHSHAEFYEQQMLASVKTPHVVAPVNIKLGNAKYQINTLHMACPPAVSSSKPRKTLVMLHGFAGGIGLWNKNLDELAETYNVLAIDILGFGRSSRPQFPLGNALAAERMLVQSLEAWRQAQHIDTMVLLGHSFGGYMASAYALRHPEAVEHLVLADPWGFSTQGRALFPPWCRGLARASMSPMAVLRAAGPVGPRLLPLLRPDFAGRFAQSDDKGAAFYNYIYHLNAQQPSGEHAFLAMAQHCGWAKRPFADRVREIHGSVPMTLIFGERTWVDVGCGDTVRRLRHPAPVAVHLVPDAGHQVYADNAPAFNALVRALAPRQDSCDDHAAWDMPRSLAQTLLAHEEAMLHVA